MPLKKPSDFYDKKPNSPFDNVKEELKNAKPEKVERISEAFDSFKSNLNNFSITNLLFFLFRLKFKFFNYPFEF